MTKFYKPIQREYLDPDTNEFKYGRFIAQGQWANGNLAYTQIDSFGNAINEEDKCMFVQVRYDGKLVMFHI